MTQNPPDGWGIEVWFLIEAVMAGYQIEEIYLGTKEHTSFDDYREDVGKLAKMAEQVEFTILKEAIKCGRTKRHEDVKTLIFSIFLIFNIQILYYFSSYQ